MSEVQNPVQTLISSWQKIQMEKKMEIEVARLQLHSHQLTCSTVRLLFC